MRFDELHRQIDWSKINNGEIVVIDLETTGLSPKTDKIIEIGAIRITAKSPEIESFSALLTINEMLTSEIVDITGITNDLLAKDGKPFYIAFGEFKKFIGRSEATIYNKKFDKGFIDSLCAKYNIPFNTYFTDSMLLCRKAFKLSGMKLSDVADHLNIPTKGAHRAVADCKITLACHMSALIELQNTNNEP